MNINARFEEIINSLYKGNKRAFAQSVGISATVVENVVGTRKGKPSYDVLEKVCANTNISAEWLLTGKGEMQRAEDRQLAIPAIKEQFSLRTDRTIGMQSVPLYELDATAGLVALFDGTTRQVPVSHLQIPDLPPCDGALYVRGDSMYPLLKSGDIVLYKEIPYTASSILWGEMYLLSFTLDGENYITIKYNTKGRRRPFRSARQPQPTPFTKRDSSRLDPRAGISKGECKVQHDGIKVFSRTFFKQQTAAT